MNYMTTRHAALFLCPRTLSATYNRVQRQTVRRCDLERSLDGDTWCVKKLSDKIQCCHFHCFMHRESLLLTLTFLPLFYENPV